MKFLRHIKSLITFKPGSWGDAPGSDEVAPLALAQMKVDFRRSGIWSDRVGHAAAAVVAVDW
jgi:hypothetical protein